MNANVRRDLIIGGAVVVFGLGLLGFALFASDDNFRAPRWAVAAAAIAFVVGGIVPLRQAAGPRWRPSGFVQYLAAALVLFVCFVSAAWVLLAVGPEGTAITLDAPLPVSEALERWIRNGLFYSIFGAGAVGLFCAAMVCLHRGLPSLGRTAFVAIVAPLVGVMVWVAYEIHRQTVPPYPPVLALTFDERFPSNGYVARAVGQLVAKPGYKGTAMWVGGNGDWIDVDAPPGFDTSHGLTLEMWMRRENWVNPYAKGGKFQQVVAVDLELDYKGRAEVRQIAFSLDVSPPRERVGAPLPDHYIFRPQARAGESRIGPTSVATSVAARRWTHVAVVYDRFLVDRLRLYVDGRQVARGMPWGAAPGLAIIRGIRIGTAAERNGAYRGMVDELRVFARPLSEDEIAADAGVRR
jgi:hypothetical protein